MKLKEHLFMIRTHPPIFITTKARHGHVSVVRKLAVHKHLDRTLLSVRGGLVEGHVVFVGAMILQCESARTVQTKRAM